MRFPNGPPIVVTTEPTVIKELFTATPDEAYAGRVNIILKPILGSNSLLLIDGDSHLRRRRLLLPPFRGERMQAYGDIIVEAVHADMATWPVSQPFSFHRRMQSITMEVILRALFGVSETSRLQRLRAVLQRILGIGDKPATMLMIDNAGDIRFESFTNRLGRLSPWARLRQARQDFDNLLDEEISNRRKSAVVGDDVFSLLISAKDDNGAQLSPAVLRDEMLTMLVAGHETTATALTWAMWLLLNNPHELATLRARVATGDTNYADAVAKETLRLRPVIPLVGREIQRPLRVGSHVVPVGSVVAPCTYLTHRRPDMWDRPTQFEPTRFVDAPAKPFAFFPFGGGIRRCIGMAFALYEMRLVLAKIVAHMDVRVKPGYRAKTTRRGITFCLSEGLPVYARRRSGRD